MNDVAHPRGGRLPVRTQLVTMSISTEDAEYEQRQDHDEENHKAGYQTGVICYSNKHRVNET